MKKYVYIYLPLFILLFSEISDTFNKYLNKLMLKIISVIGTVNNFLILGFFYFFIFVPISVIYKKINNAKKTYDFSFSNKITTTFTDLQQNLTKENLRKQWF